MEKRNVVLFFWNPGSCGFQEILGIPTGMHNLGSHRHILVVVITRCTLLHILMMHNLHISPCTTPLFPCGSQMCVFFDGFAKIDNSLRYYKQEIKRGLSKPNESGVRKNPLAH
jgi:hypothetical protein